MKSLNPAQAGLKYCAAILGSPYSAAAIYAILFCVACFHLIKGLWTGQMLVVSMYFTDESYAAWPADPIEFLLGIVIWIGAILASLAMIAEMLGKE